MEESVPTAVRLTPAQRDAAERLAKQREANLSSVLRWAVQVAVVPAVESTNAPAASKTCGAFAVKS